MPKKSMQIKLLKLAPAGKEKIDTLYHNKCLHMTLYLSILGIYLLYAIKDIDIGNFKVRLLAIFFIPSFLAVASAVFVFFQHQKEIIITESLGYYSWKLFYFLVSSILLIFVFVSFDPLSALEQFIYKFLWGPILIPYALASATFYSLVFIKAATSKKSNL